MTAERRNKIRALLSEVLNRPEGERADFLNSAAGKDLELKRAVQELLDTHREDDSFLRDPAVAEVALLFDIETTPGLWSTPDSSAPHFQLGMLLNDRYHILNLIGQGGMGEVYLANDTQINRKVALKVLHPHLVSSKESLHRFGIETQAVSALNHPHIMTIYEFSKTEEGTLFFVGEYIDGLPLSRLIGPNLHLNTALDIAMQVSSALSAAHETGITHRDIKPENIMVRRDGYVKVLDFGLAKLTQAKRSTASGGSEEPTEALHLTRPGAVMGTAAYMSPEQARGHRVDPRTDIWSLGVVIYEMLSGRRPFSGESPADIIVSVLTTNPLPMASEMCDVPAEMEWIVSKALSKSVDGRYQTAKELRSDLEKIRRRLEFEEALRNSAGSDSINAAPQAKGENVSGDGVGAATLPETAIPTSGAATLTAKQRSLWSSPGLSGVLGQVKSHQVRSSIFVLTLAALITFAVYLFVRTAGGDRKIDSIAVLPFQNTSGNSDLTYLSDGISESLIDRFSQLSQLRVISRAASFKFRDPNIDLAGIANQLGVRAIVTGSVASVGDDLVIRFDIVDAAENKHLTGGQYRRKASDLLSLQKEIAQTAAEQLRLKLTESQSKRVSLNDTEDSEAYRYYLSGLVEYNGPEREASGALEYFERAVALDPDFAAAHAEIANIYIGRANSRGNPGELLPRARAANERALSLDPNLAKAHVIQAMLCEYEFDWRNAENEYRKAIELSPNLDFARNQYAFFLSVEDRQDESLAELEQLRLRDPINRRLALLQKGIVLVQARKFDEALRTYQEAQAVEPANEIPAFALGYAYAGKGLYREAAQYYKKSVDRLGGEDKYSQPLVYLAATYARMPEKRNESRRILNRIEAMSGYQSPALLAAVYSELGENDKALQLLEQSYIKRDLLLRFIKTGYEYDGLRDDPRFNDLLKRIGLAN